MIYTFHILDKGKEKLCISTSGLPPWSSGECAGHRTRGPGLDSRHYQIFLVVVDLEQGLHMMEKLLERKSSGSGLENRDYQSLGTAALTM
jgi:hypothetical protein